MCIGTILTCQLHVQCTIANEHIIITDGFSHVTSTPRFPQANGEAERAVSTVKNLLKKSVDPYLALLAYRTSPLKNGYSPSELLMCRKLRFYTSYPSFPAFSESSKCGRAQAKGVSQIAVESEF